MKLTLMSYALTHHLIEMPIRSCSDTSPRVLAIDLKLTDGQAFVSGYERVIY